MGGEVIIYMWFFLREDFFDVFLLFFFYLKFLEEVKLFEVNVVGVEEKVEILEENDEEEEEKEREVKEYDDEDIWGNYRRLDVFEGSFGLIDEDDDEDDEVFEYGDEDVERVGLKDGEVICFFGEVEEEDEEDEEEEIGVKEKGVFVVMCCFDRVKIFVKVGDGGNGVVVFRREKFVFFGGFLGGDGGRGGNVYVEVDGLMNFLLLFRKSVYFRVGCGEYGRGKM